MTQESTQPDTPEAATRTGGRRGLLLGVGPALVVLVLVWGVQQVAWWRPRTFTTTCSGATVTGTIWSDGAGVYASVTVVDDEARSWDVAWGEFAEEVPGSAMRDTSGADYAGSLLNATQSLGDFDDGTHRTVQVRPRGGARSCDLAMHVSALW